MSVCEFILNNNALTLDELAPFFEHHVAWSADGKKILASAKELTELYRTVDLLGLKSSDFVIGYVPDPNIVDLGGALLSDISITDLSFADRGAVAGRRPVST